MSAAPTATTNPPSREQLLHMLYEAAELEHNLMCTYLYAAFSLKDGAGEGLSNKEAAAVAGWRQVIIRVAIEEMGHLTAVWNITAAIGGSPRFNRGNFPLDPGRLPASVIVRLGPFCEEVLQHFIHLERPEGSQEEDSARFAPPPDVQFRRGISAPRVTPMPIDYETVGAFYTALDAGLKAFVAHWGEDATFCGDPNLQLSATEVEIQGAKPVICLKTAAHAFKAIVEQGEGAPADSDESHFRRFIAIREEFEQLKAENPAFKPAFPAAWNPLLRRPVRTGDRVWIENEEAAETVDIANSAYALMLRLMAHSFVVPRPNPVKALAVDLGLGLMRAMTHLAERAVRLPAGPSHPDCNAGMSFSALRDAAPFPPGPAANRFFIERFGELCAGAEKLTASGDKRVAAAGRILADLKKKAERGFSLVPVAAAPTQAQSQSSVDGAKPMSNGTQPPANSNTPAASGTPPTPVTVNGVDHIEGEKMTLLYEGKKCIHSRFCVTGGPKVFIANVEGPWINPDAMDVDRLVEIAHVCPSGAIKYKRKDGKPDETAPPVNLIAIREAGPYAVRGDIRLDGEEAGYRLTLCRCGASKHKPFCDGSHHDVPFTATGEPATGKADMLAVRDGVLSIDPQLDGPLQVRGNLEITSGTGRVVSRVTSAKLCRCGGSNTKPFCDGTHAKTGFKST